MNCGLWLVEFKTTMTVSYEYPGWACAWCMYPRLPPASSDTEKHSYWYGKFCTVKYIQHTLETQVYCSYEILKLPTFLSPPTLTTSPLQSSPLLLLPVTASGPDLREDAVVTTTHTRCTLRSFPCWQASFGAVMTLNMWRSIGWTYLFEVIDLYMHNYHGLEFDKASYC